MAQAIEHNGRGRKNGHARAALRSRATDVLDDFTELRKDMNKLAEAAGKAAREEVRGASKRFGTLSSDLRTRANDGASYAIGQVREHPAAAIGISLGAGLLLGALLVRR